MILTHRLMKNSIGVSEYMLFTESFSKIKNLKFLGDIEERKEVPLEKKEVPVEILKKDTRPTTKSGGIDW